MIQHSGVVNFLTDMCRRFPMRHGDSFLSVTTMSFDISVLEIFLPLLSGATVILVGRELVHDSEGLVEAIIQSNPTIMQATPSLWRTLVSGLSGRMNGLRILVGGEALPDDLAVALNNVSPDVTNLYGPTETTIWSTVARVAADAPSSGIGRPIANTEVFVLDRFGGL
ncbi:AMP-binding protein, partial [Acrocarpospora corrugata]|uniref:AMP-binding protein n=1 Tax=Acrocarpospora corrugata TaxID=35763 RepID=UPI0031D9BF7E